MKIKKPQDTSLETSKYTRGTTQIAINATFRLKQALSLNAGNVRPWRIGARTFNSEVMGNMAISYRLAPSADSLQTFLPCRLRLRFIQKLYHIFLQMSSVFLPLYCPKNNTF